MESLLLTTQQGELRSKLLKLADLQGSYRIVSLVGVRLDSREMLALNGLKRLGILVPEGSGFWIW